MTRVNLPPDDLAGAKDRQLNAPVWAKTITSLAPDKESIVDWSSQLVSSLESIACGALRLVSTEVHGKRNARTSSIIDNERRQRRARHQLKLAGLEAGELKPSPA